MKEFLLQTATFQSLQLYHNIIIDSYKISDRRPLKKGAGFFLFLNMKQGHLFRSAIAEKHSSLWPMYWSFF